MVDDNSVVMVASRSVQPAKRPIKGSSSEDNTLNESRAAPFRLLDRCRLLR